MIENIFYTAAIMLVTTFSSIYLIEDAYLRDSWVGQVVGISFLSNYIVLIVSAIAWVWA